MEQVEQYDALVIGAGQSGGPLSTALVKGGRRRVALVEREHIGGTCINEGCTPTKTMIASGRVAYLARRGADYGVHTGDVRVDIRKVVQRKRDIVRSFREGSTRHILEGGVEIIMGEARFTAPHAVEIRLLEGETRRIEAGEIFINTGCRPGGLPIPGLDSVPARNSTTVMELEELPEHLIVLGGGYVGLEFGQLFRRLGSKVTIIERGPRLMGHEDQDIAEAVAAILREDGIEIFLNADTHMVQESDDGGIRVSFSLDGTRNIAGSHLLVAAGRKPNTEALQLEAAGVETDEHGFVKVNDLLETNAPGIWAMGDVVAGNAQFTHISYDDFRILRDNLLRGGSRSRAGRFVPYTMFTDPELGRIGLSEEAARKNGMNIGVARLPVSHIARAIEVDEQRGMIKAVVDLDTGQILGAAALAIQGGEIMAMFEIAMMGKLHYSDLREGIFAHPTLAEMFNNLFQKLDVPDPGMVNLSNADCGAMRRSVAAG